jgi:hypothetical protein
VDPGLLDMFHDRADDARLPVGNAIDIDLDRVLEEAVYQDGPI